MNMIKIVVIWLSLIFSINVGLAKDSEEKQEWVALFNGKNLDGWTPKFKGHELGENPGNIFRVKDGLLQVNYDGFPEFQDMFGHLFYKTPYSHYRLRFVYRFFGEQSKGGPDWAYRNNGAMIHCQDPKTMKLKQTFPNCVEAQVLGDHPKKKRTTGSLYTIGGTYVFLNGEKVTDTFPSPFPSQPSDKWTTLEVEVRGGDKIIHYINGNKVLEYEKLHMKSGEPLTRGYIALQAESHGTEFKSVELLQLEK